jgi:hypothetical protein
MGHDITETGCFHPSPDETIGGHLLEDACPPVHLKILDNVQHPETQ